MTAWRDSKTLGPFPRFDPADGVTVLAPADGGPGNWVGCPSVLWDPSRERMLLTYRRRRPRGGPAPDRGFECCVAESADGVSFTDLWRATKEELGTTSLERSCLQRTDGGYLLDVSYEDPEDGRWRIDVLEAPTPEALDVAGMRPVLTAVANGVDAVKDPYVLRVGPAYYMYISTFVTAAGPAPTFLATSLDGVRFAWRGEVLGVGTGWDRHQARLSGILPAGAGVFVGFYDGAGAPEEDTEERLGVAVSFDLLRWERLSVEQPWLESPHATGSLRYLDALVLDGEWWLYYEAARADGAHELRLSRIAIR